MTAELFWFPAYPSDWLGSPAISMMLPEQEGAYWRLLNLAWGNGDAEPSLPNDPAALAQMSRLGRRWKKLGPIIRAQFVEREGRLYNHKMSEVWRDQQDKHDRAVAKASLGGKARANLLRATSSATSTPEAEPGQCLEGASIELELETTTTTPVARAAKAPRRPRVESPVFVLAWTSYPKRAGSNPRQDALKQWDARIREGVSEADMFAGVERYRTFCDAMGKTGTETVMQAKRFFGANRECLDAWDVPASASQAPVQIEHWAEKRDREERAAAEYRKITMEVGTRRAKADGDLWWDRMRRECPSSDMRDVFRYAHKHIPEGADAVEAA